MFRAHDHNATVEAATNAKKSNFFIAPALLQIIFAAIFRLFEIARKFKTPFHVNQEHFDFGFNIIKPIVFHTFVLL